jgi:hypothetical protein
VEGPTPYETEEKISKAQPWEKNKDDGDPPGPVRTLSGSRSGRATLRREQREKLEITHLGNRATGKEGETDGRRKSIARAAGTVGYSGRITLKREKCGM